MTTMTTGEAVERIRYLTNRHAYCLADDEALGVVHAEIDRLYRERDKAIDALHVLLEHAKLTNCPGDDIWDAVREMAEAAIREATRPEASGGAEG